MTSCIIALTATNTIVLANCKNNKTPDVENTSYYTLIGQNQKNYFGPSDTPITNFCGNSGIYKINGKNVNVSSITSLCFSDAYNEIETIPNYWLFGCSSLSSVDFSGLSSLKSIGHAWMRDCVSLEYINFNGLSSLESVGTDWLDNCSSLSSISFFGLSSLSSVDTYWLSRCYSLSSADFSDLSSLKNVSANWLYNCFSLKNISIGKLDWQSNFSKMMLNNNLYNNGTLYSYSYDNAIGWVGTNNSSLKGWNINAENDSYMTANNTKIYFSCSNTPLSNFTNSDNCYEINGIDIPKSSITSIEFGASYASETTVGEGWMDGCENLISFDINVLSSLENIGGNWLNDCSSLTKIYVGDLEWKENFSETNFAKNVPEIGKILGGTDTTPTFKKGGLQEWTAGYYDSFLFLNSGEKLYFVASSTSLETFATSSDYYTLESKSVLKRNISSITFGVSYGENVSVGDYFLSECYSLCSVDFSELSSLSSIGNYWMEANTALKSVNFNGLSSLTEVKDGWLDTCVGLSSVNFSGLSNLCSVGDWWMANCIKISSIDFNGLSSLESVGTAWLDTALSLSSIDISSLSSLNTVGSNWLYGCSSFSNIKVGSLTWLTGFSTETFAFGVKSSGNINGGGQASSWNVGGLTNWTVN